MVILEVVVVVVVVAVFVIVDNGSTCGGCGDVVAPIVFYSTFIPWRFHKLLLSYLDNASLIIYL